MREEHTASGKEEMAMRNERERERTRRLLRLTEELVGRVEQPRLICLPAQKLLVRLFVFNGIGMLLLSLCTTIWVFWSLPVLVYWSYLYGLFGLVWRRYSLARLWIILCPVAAMAGAAGLRYMWYIR